LNAIFIRRFAFSENENETRKKKQFLKDISVAGLNVSCQESCGYHW